jgi:hypothetical protein
MIQGSGLICSSSSIYLVYICYIAGSCWRHKDQEGGAGRRSPLQAGGRGGGWVCVRALGAEVMRCAGL